MDMNKYQLMTQRTAIYPEAGTGTDRAINYCIVGLCGEVGELANKWKKSLRGDGGEDLYTEVGDILWYTARLAKELGALLADAASHNIEKLKDREDRQVLRGSGDDR